MKPTSSSLENSPIPASGATDSPWQPSWWQWLISALSGTVEIEKQTAWLRKHNEELRKSNEELRKSNEESRIKHEQRLNDEKIKHEQRLSDEKIKHEQRLSELKKQNARLAELELKLNEILHS
ncbi:MAG: hypothetical protein ACFCVD_20915 [Nodosilinea sp.]